jgi:deazaflavin-dependent oxidoreductase (nitroreductase family)
MGGEPVTTETTASPATPSLTRRERIALTLHREIDHRLSALGVWAMRRTRGSLANPWGVNALLLTTTGRRTGRERTVVLQYFPDGADMIVVAANDGGATDPAWYRNLLADPSATVEVRGTRIPVIARELAEDEGAAWWDRILLAAPDYERYARATTRRFPIIRLTPVAAAPEHAPVAAASGRRSILVLVLVAAACVGALIAARYARRR